MEFVNHLSRKTPSRKAVYFRDPKKTHHIVQLKNRGFHSGSFGHCPLRYEGLLLVWNTVCLPHWAEYQSNSKTRKPRGTTGGQRDPGEREARLSSSLGKGIRMGSWDPQSLTSDPPKEPLSSQQWDKAEEMLSLNGKFQEYKVPSNFSSWAAEGKRVTRRLGLDFNSLKKKKSDNHRGNVARERWHFCKMLPRTLDLQVVWTQ